MNLFLYVRGDITQAQYDAAVNKSTAQQEKQWLPHEIE
jgi:hypothetical protein